MDQPVAEILPSAHWDTAIVIVLDCGHRHVRPATWTVHIGAAFDCCFCDDAPSRGIPVIMATGNWTKEDVERIAASRRRTQGQLEARPVETTGIDIGVASRSKYRAVPCIVTEDLTLFTAKEIGDAEAHVRLPEGKDSLKKRAARLGIIGEWFGSTKEGKYWIALNLRERAGEISELRRQVPIDLCCEGGLVVSHYIADFTYRQVTDDGRRLLHVVDAKGKRTAMYALKAKWLNLQSGLHIEEV